VKFCTGAYPPTDRYAKLFYCSTFGLNIKFSHMCWIFLNMAMDMQKLPINVTIQNILKNCKYICGDFIFTAVCHVNHQSASWATSLLWIRFMLQSFTQVIQVVDHINRIISCSQHGMYICISQFIICPLCRSIYCPSCCCLVDTTLL
jgi:hypothetical protein